MSIELITILLFLGLFVLLVTGLPIAFCIGGLAIIFGYLFLWGDTACTLFSLNLIGYMTEYSPLLAIPLFIYMANMLQQSQVAENLYDMMYKWFGFLRGGLAIGTVLVCTIIAAMSGLSATGTVTMGLTALPAMLKRKYDKTIAIGSIAAGGALGSLIPPSVPMMVYCLVAQLSVGKMFLGGILPGILLSSLFILYIAARSFYQPSLCPALKPDERATWVQKIESLRAVILPIFLIIAVLGSIFSGIATPTEAAAVGAFGSIICAVVNRKLTLNIIKQSAYMTLKLTVMVLWIMVAASFFTSIYNSLGAAKLVSNIFSGLGVPSIFIIVLMQFLVFILGFVMDPNGILLITIPIFAPIVVALGYDPIWFGILFMVNIEMAYLTPPFGWNLFYMKAVAPPEIKLSDIYRAIIPFVCLQIIGFVLVFLFPQIALLLPQMFISTK